MEITEEIYEAAWAKRKVATEGYRVQLEEDMAVARSLPFGQQTRAAMDAADRYDEACKPAVVIWQRDLGVKVEEVIGRMNKIKHTVGWYGWYRRYGYSRLEALSRSIRYVWL